MRIPSLFPDCRPRLVALAAGLVLSVTPAVADVDGARDCPSDEGFAVVADYRYVVSARVRPLLFWIHRDNVGDARLTWSARRDGASRIELLIGSDPLRAPLRINRWGYISETTCATTTSVVGLMSESDEQSLDEAKAKATDAKGRHAFKAIRGLITPGEAQAYVTRVLVDEDFTYRDLPALLGRVPSDAPPNRRLATSARAEQGFLAVTHSLVRAQAAAFAQTGRADAQLAGTLAYVHGDRAYDLAVLSVKPGNADLKGIGPTPVLHASLQARNRTTGRTTSFTVVTGAANGLAGVPVRILYRPRWWLEVELRLVEATRPPVAIVARGGQGPTPATRPVP